MKSEIKREELIYALADSVGIGGGLTSRYEESRYDAETGTLYCDGTAITQVTIEEAQKHFELMAKKAKESSNQPMKNMGLFYKTAAEAIKMMMGKGQSCAKK